VADCACGNGPCEVHQEAPGWSVTKAEYASILARLVALEAEVYRYGPKGGLVTVPQTKEEAAARKAKLEADQAKRQEEYERQMAEPAKVTPREWEETWMNR
jgi:hypothetical protein